MIEPGTFNSEITIRKAILDVVQLNQGHARSYDRDDLVRMLDQALAPLPNRR